MFFKFFKYKGICYEFIDIAACENLNMKSYCILLAISLLFVLNSSGFIIQSKYTKRHINLANDHNVMSQSHYLWEIEGKPPSYIFGTIHVPYIMLWDAIPKNMMQAFNNTQSLFLELDMSEDTLLVLQSCQQLPNNHTVSEVLPSDIYLKFVAYMEHVYAKIGKWLTGSQKNQGLTSDIVFNLLFDGWECRRPIWTLMKMQMVIKSLITSIEYPQLDSYLGDLGRRHGKFVGGIENVNDTCSIINNIDESQVLFILNKTLGQNYGAFSTMLDSTEQEFENLVKHYRDGTIAPNYFTRRHAFFPQLYKIEESNGSRSLNIDVAKDKQMATEIDTYLRHHIIFKRNELMTEGIIDLIENNKNSSFFFAFGVGHFIGKNSVIDMLQEKGRRTVRVSRYKVIPESNPGSSLKNSSTPVDNHCTCEQYRFLSWFMCILQCALGF